MRYRKYLYSLVASFLLTLLSGLFFMYHYFTSASDLALIEVVVLVASIIVFSYSLGGVYSIINSLINKRCIYFDELRGKRGCENAILLIRILSSFPWDLVEARYLRNYFDSLVKVLEIKDKNQ